MFPEVPVSQVPSEATVAARVAAVLRPLQGNRLSLQTTTVTDPPPTIPPLPPILTLLVPPPLWGPVIVNVALTVTLVEMLTWLPTLSTPVSGSRSQPGTSPLWIGEPVIDVG